MKASIVGLSCAALLLCTGATARADSIAVTGGAAGTDFVVASVHLISDQFDFFLFGSALNIFQMPNSSGFHAGDTVDFSATINGPLINGGRDVIDGIFYRDQGALLATANRVFNATPVTVTASTGQFGLLFQVGTPFTMSGFIQLDRNIGTSFNPVHGDVILRSDVVGAGTLDVIGFSRGGTDPTALSVASPTFAFAAQSP